MLVGSATADDAGVFRIGPNQALVQTIDFFTPIVDDPYLFGQIAAANALSDIYAMGGRPLTAMAVVGMPTEILAPEVIRRILKGGAAKVKEARCALIGGHSIKNPEPVYGLAVTGLVDPRRMMVNSKARPGDWLVLTKPLGTGIISTGIKRGTVMKAAAARAIRQMRRLNEFGAEVAERGWVRAATDVTGFGLLGHLGSMCRASGVSATLMPAKFPIISNEVLRLVAERCVPGGTRENVRAASEFTDWGTASEVEQVLASDAQTSGGLLLCVPSKVLDSVLKLAKKNAEPCAAVIGRIERGAESRIRFRT